MPNPRSTKGHDFEPLSYEVLGACIDMQWRLGLTTKSQAHDPQSKQ